MDEEAIRLAIDLIIGAKVLEPRSPKDPDCVEHAERTLGAHPRPIYAFVGDLHPELGNVGLVISRQWAARYTQGVSACDTGGLAGRKGCFIEIPEDSVDEALRELSTPEGIELEAWEQRFSKEIEASYSAGAGGYIRGDEPDTSRWTDPRRRCIEATPRDSESFDRRLWTWEIRFDQPPQPKEIEALVVSYESGKVLRAERRRRGGLPRSVRVVKPEKPVGELEDWFRIPEVWALLGGE